MLRLSAYLAQSIVEKDMLWGLDQAAFYVVYRMMDFRGEAVSLASMPKTLCDHDFGDSSDVWAAKGDRKENAIFEREGSRLLATPQSGQQRKGE